jgi:chorismate mutase
MSNASSPPPLAELRAEIDRIDEEMHRLLMQRGEIIDRLIRVKRTEESGSAFRPAREAEMMRRLVERHRGILPLDTAESILRVIIATFTFVQAPFRVHADLSAGEAAMRDTERFHFGFTVPLVAHMGAAGVVAEVGKSKGDLGLVSATTPGSAWWSALEGDGAPKIIARLPFVERADHPAGLPVLAIARPHPDAIIRDVTMWSMRVSGWTGNAARAASALLAELIAIPEGSFDGAALLVSVPQGKTVDDIVAALRGAGVSVRSQALVGSHATRYIVGVDDARPVPTGR